MPTLNWIGKEKVVNHHLDVPFRTLEKKYTFAADGQGDGGNMVIHGDNLDALKALLPMYEGKVKCIYIDPPYNTGNEKWVYNDNVNDPHIRAWLGKVVGAEDEDFSRHDKWLCMMYPRLKLLQKLLADDGVIFISIDDNEIHNLKQICDDIFGIKSFVANISWQRTYSKRNDSKGIPSEIEYILVYSKQPHWTPFRLQRTEEMNDSYKNIDGDSHSWSSVTINAPGASTHQGMVYAIQHPLTGELLYPPKGRCWSFGQTQLYEYMNEWTEYVYQPIDDYDKRCDICGSKDGVPLTIAALLLKNKELGIKEAKIRYELGLKREKAWPLLYFTNNGKGGIRRKQYLEQSAGRVATNLWPHTEVGHTGEATNELSNIFNDRSPIETPKPTRLVERIIQLATNNNSIILDSFAGSGTTAHAVLNMNKRDGGHRKFILVEMMDYADNITAERVKRVIQGYGEGKKAVEGTGGGFSYYELGEALLVDGLLNPDVSVDKIRAYVYYTETRAAIPPQKEEEPYLLGVHNDHAYYFYYEKDRVTTLNHAFLGSMKTAAQGYLIYADVNALSAEEMEKYHITFKKIPRDIAHL